MIELFNLEELGHRIRKTDKHLISLLSQRMRLALQVEEFKLHYGIPIFRPDIEDIRLKEARKWAKEKGINPNFAHAILYMTINESCKIQSVKLQQDSEKEHNDNQETLDESLKNSLLNLTTKVAPAYDDKYDQSFFATRSYSVFEMQILKRELEKLPDRSLALDIGCATGRVAFEIAPYFHKVLGYDIGPAMIEQAKARLLENNVRNLVFETVDVEQGIPVEDASASFIVMSMGMGSEIRNISGVLVEAKRVLKSGGKLFISFYNADALLYQWEFIPWPVSLAAEINIKKQYLDVHYDGEIYPIYASPYSISKIKDFFSDGFELTQLLTYPTISSILPNEICEEKVIQELIAEIDCKLAESTWGAYAIAIVSK